MSRLLIAITSGHWIWGAAERQAAWKADAGAAPAYVYIFGWKDPFAGSICAVHGEDVGFIFNRFEVPDYLEFGVDSAELRAAADPSGRRYVLRDAAMDVWLSFARTGTPSCPLLPTWPRVHHRSAADHAFGR
jgi:carboxylesterase type B